MSIINDALKKTQLNFKKKPKNKEKEKAENTLKPNNDDVANVYDKMYKAREEQRQASSSGAVPAKKSSKGSKTPQKADGWLKTVLAFLFLAASLTFAFKFLSGYEPLQDFLLSQKWKKKSSRTYIVKHMPKKRTYKASDMVLNGISIVDGKKVALINDEIHQVGDVVNNKEIISITHDTVELRGNEKIYTIKVR